MNSEVIFNILNESYFDVMTRDSLEAFVQVVVLPVFLVSIIILFAKEKKIKSARTYFSEILKRENIKTLFIVIVLSIIFFVPKIVVTYDYLELRKALLNNNCLVVEGVISDMNYLQEGQLGKETFKVGSVKFSISPVDVSAGYNKIAVRGGVLRPGMSVRMYYLRSSLEDTQRIAKIELLED